MRKQGCDEDSNVCKVLLLAHMEGLDTAGDAIWVLLEVLQAVSKPDGALA